MIYWELATILLLVLFNGFLAMSELAIVSSRRPRLQALAEEGHRGARIALSLWDESGRFLSTVQVGITLVGIIAGAFGGATLAVHLAQVLETTWLVEWAEEIAFTVVVAMITYLSVIVGELVPKQIALSNPERIAVLVAPPMAVLSRLAGPAVTFLDFSSRIGLRLFGLRRAREHTVTEEEIKLMVAEATRAGVVEHTEKAMISGVLRLGELPVQAIMTPRPDVVWLDLEDPDNVNREKMRKSGHSRFPVARGDLDELFGVVQARDTLSLHRADLAAFVKEPLIVPEGADALMIAELLRRHAVHLAIVVDEYGSVQGVVTAADVLEAIMGTLSEVEEGEEAEVVERPDGGWLMDGGVAVDTVKNVLGLKSLPEEGEYHTLAGFLLLQLAHVPHAGERLMWGGYVFEVVDMDGNRIDKVLVTKEPQAIT